MLTSNEISHEHDLKKILALFTIDYFVHNIDLLALSGTKCRPQNSDDETVLADEIDYVWHPDWSHPLLINIPTDISSQANTTISINKDYVRTTPLTFDATPLNFNALFTEQEIIAYILHSLIHKKK